MIDLFNFSFDAIAISALTCLVLREIFIAAMPSGGFFDTDPRG
jgi:hypothetical protein